MNISLQTFFDLFFVLYAMVGIGAGWAVYDDIDRKIESSSRLERVLFGILCGLGWPIWFSYMAVQFWLNP